jgi:membrane protein involved in colicin uptake
MSRQNKVNPGMYTQRGRLTQDDAARELKNQRNVGAPHTWQHGTNDKLPSFKGSEPVQHAEEEEDKAAPPTTQKPLRAKKQTAAPAVKAKAKSAKKSAPQTKAKAKAKPKAAAKTRKTPARKTAKKAKAKAKSPARKTVRRTRG